MARNQNGQKNCANVIIKLWTRYFLRVLILRTIEEYIRLIVTTYKMHQFYVLMISNVILFSFIYSYPFQDKQKFVTGSSTFRLSFWFQSSKRLVKRSICVISQKHVRKIFYLYMHFSYDSVSKNRRRA